MEWASKVIVMLACFAAESLTKEECQSEGMNLRHLGTKTPYRFVKLDDTKVHFPGCVPVRAWMMVRHGTRYPGGEVIRKMTESLPHIRDNILAARKAGKGSLCSEEIAALERWKCNVEDADQKRLAHEGEDEMVDLAERFQQRFPQLFPEEYSNDTYKFYKACHRWKKDVDKNPESVKEKLKFLRGPEMKATLEEIRTRLGLNASLTLDDTYLLYVACSFETAWDKRRASPWCAAFSEKNLEVFEYAEDLEYYWIDGYGFNITYRQACPAVRDMMTYLLTGKTLGKTHSPHAVVYFSHSGSLLKILAHLSLYRDHHILRHDNFNLLGAERKWRVSYIDAFGTNLAFILFRCGGESQVLTLHQERPVALPGCPGAGGLCPVSTLMKTFHHSVHACDFDEMCRLPQQSRGR